MSRMKMLLLFKKKRISLLVLLMILIAFFVFTGGVVVTKFRHFGLGVTEITKECEASVVIKDVYLKQRVPLVLYYVSTHPDRNFSIVIKDWRERYQSARISNLELQFENGVTVNLPGIRTAEFSTRESLHDVKQKWSQAAFSVNLKSNLTNRTLVISADCEIMTLKNEIIPVKLQLRSEFSEKTQILTRWQCYGAGWYIE